MKTYQAFIEWFQCACGCKPTHGIVRLFEASVANLKDGSTWAATKLAPDGMPDCAWAWSCNIELQPDGKTVFVKAALTAPPVGSLRTMKALARQIGAEFLTWERLEEGQLREKTFPTYPATTLSETAQA